MPDRSTEADDPPPPGKRNLLDLRCRHATEMISDSMDAPLRPAERWGLGLHLLLCNSCRRYSAQLDFLRRAHRRAAETESVTGDPGPNLPADLRRRIVTRLEDELRAE
ncbi:MAG: hypothetical protein SFX72_09780 [Isosphaeraceae bacterium]|nr:hypothetical protein [Isosphaeraceae bacterium]